MRSRFFAIMTILAATLMFGCRGQDPQKVEIYLTDATGKHQGSISSKSLTASTESPTITEEGSSIDKVEDSIFKIDQSIEQTLAACIRKFPDTNTIQFHGQHFIAALETYTLTLRFNDKPHGFSYETNWGIDSKETLDLDNLLPTYTHNASWFPSVSTYPCAVNPSECLEIVNNTINFFSIVENNLLTSNKNDREILQCATDLTDHFALKIREKFMYGGLTIQGPRTSNRPLPSRK